MKSKNNIDNYSKVFFSLMLLGLFFYSYYLKDRMTKNSNYQIVNAKIFGVTTSKGRGTVVKYSYTINNKVYFGNDNVLFISDYNTIEKYFINKYFSLKIDKKHPYVSRLIIFPSQFKENGLSFPDTLNWVKKYEPARNDL